MATRANFVETPQPKNDFIHFEDRLSDHPFVEKVWRRHSQRTGMFSSVAANSFEIVVTHLGGKRLLTLRGPETQATSLDCPGEGKWVAIRFRAGTFMPRLLPGTLRDHNDVNLPDASAHSFWLNGSALDYPDFDNAETFVKRLVKSGLLARDPVVEDALQRRENVSLRSVQRHFLRSAGVTFATFRQIERARYATNLLREGFLILDVVGRLGYFDQAHLTRSLKRFIGETPAGIIQGRKQLSFLYKTDSHTEAIVVPDPQRAE